MDTVDTVVGRVSVLPRELSQQEPEGAGASVLARAAEAVAASGLRA